MREHLQPDEPRPATAEANAGRKMPVQMSAEEKQQQRERLMNVSDEEKEKAIEYVGNFITGKMKRGGYTTRNGPFSTEEMQGDAVEVISWDCYCAIFYGERRWPGAIDLKTVLCGIAWSKMNHIITAYSWRKTHPTLSGDDVANPNSLEKEMEEAAGMFNMELSMRDLGIEIAMKAVGENEQFLQYLEALQEARSYELMAERMHMTVRGVYKLEKALLKYLEAL